MIAISPHTHCESQLTGSPLTSMIGRAKEMGRTHFAYTDLGHLSSCLKAYGLCKPDKRKPEELVKANQEYLKKELKFAPGIEFYFKDSKCDIVTGTPADRCKYFTGTLYCTNQTAYQELVRTVSKTDMPKTEILEEEQNLWSWSELEHLSKFDTLLVIGGVHCMVGKALLASDTELAEKILLKIKSLFKDRLSLALICEPWNKKYATVVKVEYTDGTHDSLLSSDIVTTDKARKIKVADLIKRGGHTEILSKVVGFTFFEVGKRIANITEHMGFLPLPKDATLEINKFLWEMGKKHNILVLASDYAFYSSKEDHAVQTMVLEGKNKLKSDLHMKTEAEFVQYLTDTLGLSVLDAAKF